MTAPTHRTQVDADDPPRRGWRAIGDRPYLLWGTAFVWFAFLFVWTQLPAIAERIPQAASLFPPSSDTLPARMAFAKLRAVAVAGIIAFLLAAGASCCRRKPGFPLRTLSLALVHGMIFALAQTTLDAAAAQRECASTDRFERLWYDLRQLQVVDVCSPTLLHFDPRDCSDPMVTSFEELARRIATRFEADKEAVRRELDVSEEEARVVFSLHAAATWWTFGNGTAVDRCGSALFNEENSWNSPEKVGVRTYLDASIGCCSEMAYLLKTLLDHQQIPNRLTAIPGHVFNEVRIGGAWRIVDPTIYAMADTSWERLYSSAPPPAIRIKLYSHPHLRDANDARYRALTGQFRLMMVQRFATRPDSLRSCWYPNLPAPFAATRPPTLGAEQAGE